MSRAARSTPSRTARFRTATARPERVADDTGGVWINTGWVLGVLVYIGVVLAWHAGFGAALPFVVIPAVLVVMIGAGNLVGGRSNRKGPQFRRPDLDPAPVSVLHGERPSGAGGDGAGGATAGEPGTPG